MAFRGVPIRNLFTLVVLLACGMTLTGCDKCGDYFFINGAAPRSCKALPADQ